jgi:hypothetical protein
MSMPDSPSVFAMLETFPTFNKICTENLEVQPWPILTLFWVTGGFFGLCPSSDIVKNTFRKLDLFSSSGKEV